MSSTLRDLRRRRRGRHYANTHRGADLCADRGTDRSTNRDTDRGTDRGTNCSQAFVRRAGYK